MSRRQRNAGVVASQQPPEDSTGFFMRSGVNQFQAAKDSVTSPANTNLFIEETQGRAKSRSPSSTQQQQVGVRLPRNQGAVRTLDESGAFSQGVRAREQPDLSPGGAGVLTDSLMSADEHRRTRVSRISQLWSQFQH